MAVRKRSTQAAVKAPRHTAKSTVETAAEAATLAPSTTAAPAGRRKRARPATEAQIARNLLDEQASALADKALPVTAQILALVVESGKYGEDTLTHEMVVTLDDAVRRIMIESGDIADHVFKVGIAAAHGGKGIAHAITSMETAMSGLSRRKTPVPAVPISESIAPDYLVCLEDGEKLKLLRRHLRNVYNMTPSEYRARWGLPADYPMTAPNYSAHRSALAKANGLGHLPPTRRRSKKVQVADIAAASAE